MRLRERRRYNYAGRAPSVRTALRQLRMRVLEARGPAGIGAFVERVHSVTLLANLHHEAEAASVLSRLPMVLARGGEADMRETAYTQIDRACGALRQENGQLFH